MPPSNAPGSIILVLIFVALFVWIWSVIFKKAGYPRAVGLLMLVPVVNVVTLIYFAVAEWPIQVELARIAPQGERDRPTDKIDTMLRQAAALEQRGEWQEAIKSFEILADELRGQPGAAFAAHSAKRIRERHLPRSVSTA